MPLKVLKHDDELTNIIESAEQLLEYQSCANRLASVWLTFHQIFCGIFVIEWQQFVEGVMEGEDHRIKSIKLNIAT